MRPTAVCRRGSRRLSGGAARTPVGPGPLPTPPESPQPGGRIFWRLVGLLSAIQQYASGLPLRGFPVPGCRPAAFVRQNGPLSGPGRHFGFRPPIRILLFVTDNGLTVELLEVDRGRYRNTMTLRTRPAETGRRCETRCRRACRPLRSRFGCGCGRTVRSEWGASVSRSRLSAGGRWGASRPRLLPHTKKRSHPAMQPPDFEPKPRFELGTPSLRVKCSTAELFRPGKTSCLLSDCKYLKKFLFLQQFCKKSLISSYLRV